MQCFTPPKANRPANLWAPLPATKSTTTATTTTTANPRIAITTPTMTSTCKTCKTWDHLVLSLPNQPNILHHRNQIGAMRTGMVIDKTVREEERNEQQKKEKEENKVPNDYCPASLVYDPTYKQDLLSHCCPKKKQALLPSKLCSGRRRRCLSLQTI